MNSPGVITHRPRGMLGLKESHPISETEREDVVH